MLGVLAAVLGLLLFSMIKSDRVYEKINSIEAKLSGEESSNFKSQISNETRKETPRTSLGAKRREGVLKHGQDARATSARDEGDWLVWALGAEAETLNPVTSKDLYGYYICWRNIFEGLMEYDSDTLKLVPKLAKNYEVTDGGLTITFTLRDDIYFSDGLPVTAEDVKFTYDTIRDPKVDAAKWAQYYMDVKTVEILDPKTIRFRLANVYFKMLDYISFVDIGILPKHIYQYKEGMEFNNRRSEPVGSGPYVFEKWNVGREVVLARNERYWGEKPCLKKLVFRFITNQLAVLQAFKTGDVDFMIAEPDQFAEMCEDKNFTSRHKCLSVWNPNVGYGYMGWNADTAFFEDRRVRLAMTMLVDREMICKYLLKGLGEVPADPFYIKGPLHDPNLKPWPCDVVKAKVLLDEAGWRDTDGDGVREKDGVKFRFKFMHVAGRSLHEQLAKHLRDQCAKAGIQAVADPFEWSVFLTRLLDRKFDAVTLAWFTDVVEDPYEVFHSSQRLNRGSNHVGFVNKEADEIMEKARRVMDANERAVLYKRIARILHEEQPITYIYTRPTLRFIDPRFENVKAHNIGLDWLEWWVEKGRQKY
ncbi:MAG: hypothetical protein A2Y07_09480 [Planctomycetes bacterium GWF2_50_10]|nr:MAG: hypothetical protein A2Y07_09480 [Planctomycetes bacterium GWF2_50_10]